MKIYLSSPSGWEFRLEKEPMDKGKFYGLVLLGGGGVYAYVIKVAAENCGFWALLWLLGATLVVLLIVGYFYRDG